MSCARDDAEPSYPRKSGRYVLPASTLSWYTMTDMAIATGQAATTSESLTIYVRRALEALWLLTAAFAPLIFVPKEFFLSEAVNSYVEVPKTTGFRTLVGMMTVLV